MAARRPARPVYPTHVGAALVAEAHQEVGALRGVGVGGAHACTGGRRAARGDDAGGRAVVRAALARTAVAAHAAPAPLQASALSRRGSHSSSFASPRLFSA